VKHPKIIVILLNWNGKKDTLECLGSLQKVSSPRFTTIVIDNGSTDDSVNTIRAQFPQVPIFETKANLGFAGGNNIGIEWALRKKAEWILLLNNDTVVAPDFLDQFMKAAQEKPEAKILGAKIYRYNSQTIDHLGGAWNPYLAEFISRSSGTVDDGIHFEQMEPVEYVCGAALLMHRSVPETIGLLEPKFFLFWEETDFCTRALHQGFGVWTAPQAKVWHKVSSSFSGGKPHMHYFWWRSRLLWLERNTPFAERRAIHRRIVFPQLWKMARHALLRSLQNGMLRLVFRSPSKEQKEKAARYRAGLLGALHYAMGRFGNCPPFLTSKK
jgi:GT2 family glycosyltransferase